MYSQIANHQNKKFNKLLRKARSRVVKIPALTLVAAAVVALVVGMVRPSASYATVPGVNALVSVDSSSNQANDDSAEASVSGNGRYVAFTSLASNLVASDTNNTQDVFVRDTQNGTTSRISVSTSGTQSNNTSSKPAISYDGRYVVFQSAASNLVSGDTNGTYDVFERDIVNNTTTLVSASSSGTIGNNSSQQAALSADGRFVVFMSGASNLTSDSWQYAQEIFLKDMSNGAIKAVSIDSGGTLGNGNSSVPSISCDGGVIAFSSYATNFISGDPYLTNPTNANNYADLYISVQGIGGARITSPSLAGAGNGASEYVNVSCDGNKILSRGPGNLVGSSYYGLLLFDRLAGTYSKVSLPDNDADGSYNISGGSLSGDGRYVAFYDNDTAFGGSANRYNIYVRDVMNQTTQMVSVSSGLSEGNNSSDLPMISADGSHVSYLSYATNLVSSDTNAKRDVFNSQTGF